MKSARWIVCKSFLEKCPAQKRQALLQYITPSDREYIKRLPKTFQNPLNISDDIAHLLVQIHPSWFSSFLRAYTETEIMFFLSALPLDYSEALRKELFFTKPLQKIPEFTKKYLQTLLMQNLFEQGFTPEPKELLPDSPLNAIVSLGIENMNTLVQLLSMHDLSLEMRMIIETAKIKAIQNILTNHEKIYLNSLSPHKQAFFFGKAYLPEWDGGEESLRKHLLQKGMNRLAKACYGMNRDFLWYVQHSLETDRSHLFTKLCVRLENPHIIEILIAQILDIVSYLKNSKMSKPV